MSVTRPVTDILFRGWDPINKTWRYGNLTTYLHLGKDPDIRILAKVGLETFQQFFVVPESIGQSTGLFDESGSPIFEGDLIIPTDKYREYLFQTYGQDTWTWTEPLEVYFKDGAFMTDAGMLFELKHGRRSNDGLLEAQVIGSAYEKKLQVS